MGRVRVCRCLAAGVLAASSLCPGWALGGPGQPASEPVELPGVISRFQAPVPGDLPTISVDEIEKCMGAQAGLAARRKGVEDGRAALMQQSQSLEADQQALTAWRERVLAQQEQIRRAQAGLNAGNQRIQDQRGVLEQAKGRSTLPPERQARARQIELFNAQVKTHNQDVAAFNQQLVAANRAVAEFNAAREAFNARVAALQPQQQVHSEQVAAFNRELKGLQTRCEGQRRLVKDAAAP